MHKNECAATTLLVLFDWLRLMVASAAVGFKLKPCIAFTSSEPPLLRIADSGGSVMKVHELLLKRVWSLPQSRMIGPAGSIEEW